MQILKKLLLTTVCLMPSSALAQELFDYNPPALGSSEAVYRRDLNLEYDGINSEKIDFVDIDTSGELRSVLTDEIDTGALVFLGTPADDQVPVGDSASDTTWRTLPDSDGATQKLQYDQATNSFSAGTDDDVPESEDVTLAGDVDGAFDNNDLDEAAVEAEIEPTLDTLDNLTNIGSADSPTKGDLLTGDGTNWDDLAVGIDGQCLVADSAQTLGIKWDSCAAGAGDNLGADADRGDITISGGAGAVANIDPDVIINGATPVVNIQGNDAGAVGPILKLQHDSASPADGDIAGDIQVFAGADDEEVGRIALEVDDGATTTEDTRWRFFNDVAGASVESLTLTGATASFVGSVTAATDLIATAGDVTSGDDLISGDDVLLSDAGVINFNAGDCTLTEGTNTLTIAGTCTLVSEVVVPDGDNTRDLGSAAATWATFHSTTIELGNATDATIARTAAGEASLEGDAIKHAGKQMFWVGAGAFKNSALSPASCGDAYDSGTNDVSAYVCAFDTGATEENAEVGFSMPKGWNESTITMQVAWTNTGGASTETVQWKIACTGFGDDDALNTAYPADVTISDTWLAQNDYHLTAETGSITVQNAAENDWVNCRFGRDTSVDNMAGDALLLGIKVFWTDNASTLAE